MMSRDGVIKGRANFDPAAAAPLLLRQGAAGRWFFQAGSNLQPDGMKTLRVF
jgi:hypothetical protein